MVVLPKATPEEAVRSDLIPDIFNVEAKRFAYGLFNGYGKCHRKGVFRMTAGEGWTTLYLRSLLSITFYDSLIIEDASSLFVILKTWCLG